MNPKLRNEIIEFLTPFSFLQSENGRKALLFSAGLDQVIPDIDLSGSARECVTLLVTHLDAYGALPDGQAALVQFLQAVAAQVGADRQKVLQGLCKRYEQDRANQGPSAAQESPAGSQREITAQRDYIERVNGQVFTGPVTIYHGSAPAADAPVSAPAEQPEKVYDAFVCYAKKDQDRARKLYRELCQAGVQPWMACEDILPGQDWEYEINQALTRSRFVLALLSSNSVSQRGYIQKELTHALNVLDQLPPSTIFLIPARLDECEPLDSRLQRLHRVDLFPDYSEGLQWILRVLIPGKRSTPESRNKASAIVQGVKLQEFSFETVTVNAKGKVLQRTQRRAQQHLEDLGHGVTLALVPIPGGTFLMGAPASEKDSSDDERPQHQVTLSPFLLGKYPVTQAQWVALMGQNPSRFKGPQRPVETVSWLEAQEFCQKISEKTGAAYRLPTEAEWEYACRAGTTTPFYFGPTITTELVNYDGNYPYNSAPKGIYRKETTEVGSFPPNAFGLYDMHGNVWEWCQDWYGAYSAEAVLDPCGPASGSGRVARGGSWGRTAEYCRTANRGGGAPDSRGTALGFRLVRTPS